MSDGAQLVPGMIFGKDFQVVSKLAAGGMGTVYVAQQISTGKQRALKVMHSQYEGDSKARQRFVQEARAGANIDSDHMVETVGAGVDEETGSPWIAMELLKGQDLKQTVNERGALPADEVLEIFRQMCHALAAAHLVGLVHRDLKPENIFLAVPRREGIPFTVKILDFGIAKLVAESSLSSHHTQAVGSPRWMAPEQAERGGEIRPATDVWALGLVAFQLFTGFVFWKTANTEKPSVMQQMCEVLMDPIDPPSTRARLYDREELIPPGFDAWFARCVNRDADLRFQDASEAMAAFNALFEASGMGSRPASLRGGPMNRRSTSLSAPMISLRSPPLSPRERQVTPARLPTFDPLHLDRGLLVESVAEPSAQAVPRPEASGLPVLPRSHDAYDLGDTSAAPMKPPMKHTAPSRATSSGEHSLRPSGSSLSYVAAGIAGVVVIASVVFAAVSIMSRETPTPPRPDALSSETSVAISPSRDVPGQPVANLPEAVGDVGGIEPLIPPEITAAGRGPHINPHPAIPPTAPLGRDTRPDAELTAGVSPEATEVLREQVGEAIGRSRSEITQCFERAARTNPELRGSLEVNFMLDPSGQVSSIHTRGLDAAPEVGTCVSRIVQAITLPTSQGNPQLFSFTFRFERAAPVPVPQGPVETPAPASAPDA